jgi:hypothetical protein
MELNDLKSDWQNAGGAFKSKADLTRMTKVINHPSLKKIRIKLITETIGLLLFLFIYYDWFDGNQKPFYANFLLISGLLLYIFNDVIGYISLMKPGIETNLKQFIHVYLVRIKRLSIFSSVISFLYGVSIVVFFTSTINFTKEKSLLLLFFIVVCFQMYFFVFRMWSKWINDLTQQVKDFDLDEVK